MTTVKQLQAFMAVVSGGSFQAAARRLNTSQPAISRRISELEQDLGVKLFERTTRTCHVTPRGRLLIPRALNILRDLSGINAQVAEPGGVLGLVRLGVVETIALTTLPYLLKRLAADHPGVAIDVEVDVTGALVRNLQSREIDLGLVVAPVAEEGLTAEPLWDMDLAWFGEASRQDRERPLSAEDLAYECVLLHTRSRYGGAIQRWFREAGVHPRRTINCSSLAAVIRMISQGVGIGLVPRAAVEGDVGELRIMPIPTSLALPRNSFVMIYHTDEAEPATQACIRLFRAVALEGVMGRAT